MCRFLKREQLMRLLNYDILQKYKFKLTIDIKGDIEYLREIITTEYLVD